MSRPDLPAPRLEGTIGLPDGRRMSFAEFGDPQGRPFVWLHGTPGARRQIPPEARLMAEAKGLRLIGIDRPGIGGSTSHVYDNVLAFTDDLTAVADALGLDRLGLIALSGGGPFALAAGAAMPERVAVIGVLGGVAPTRGEDAVEGGVVALAVRLAPLILAGRLVLGTGLSTAIRLLRPVAEPGIALYGRVSPDGDRRILSRPELKAMFLDDLIGGGSRQMHAPVSDVITFTRHWGFALADVGVPVIWWHGDADHIVPYRHGEQVVARLPEAELRRLPGESHLAGLGVAEDVLTALLERWDRAGPADTVPPRGPAAQA
jgi:pimeloyl-ACP methyl ester carboxylesterase